MQACHQDKTRFNILDKKSSVWPSSLLPDLESKCCERKSGLPSVMTHLAAVNAKDTFLPRLLSFFYSHLFCLLSFSNPFFMLPSHYSLSLSSFLLFPLPLSSFLSFHLPSNFCSALPPLSSSQTAASHPLLLGLYP